MLVLISKSKNKNKQTIERRKTKDDSNPCTLSNLSSSSVLPERKNKQTVRTVTLRFIPQSGIVVVNQYRHQKIKGVRKIEVLSRSDNTSEPPCSSSTRYRRRVSTQGRDTLGRRLEGFIPVIVGYLVGGVLRHRTRNLGRRHEDFLSSSFRFQTQD